MLMMGYVLIHNGHLATADACAYVAHTIVISYCRVLVVWVRITSLGGIPHYIILAVSISTYEGTTTRGGNHLVAVKGQYAELAESAKYLSFEP